MNHAVPRYLSSWGRLYTARHHVIPLDNPDEVAGILKCSTPGIARGLGRSYGDVALNPEGIVWDTTRMNRFIHFDRTRGILRCEAGTSLREIQRVILPQGFSLPVIPGTQHITVGGAIANDVHGKNHHRYGSFGNQVFSFTLQRSNGERFVCSATENRDFFRATIGGMGLTGIILDAALQLRPIAGPWLDTQTLPFIGLRDFFNLANVSENDWEYTVAWIDCIARNHRGLFMRANHSLQSDVHTCSSPPKHIRLTPPVSPFSFLTLNALNSAYFHLKSRTEKKIRRQRLEPFFYPLDALADWNRLYGSRGFYQYQCVVPAMNGHSAISAILDQITASGEGSFLAVLKKFGAIPARGMLSFPQADGITLALDFPNRRERTLHLFEQLDHIVTESGGRLYPAKDARMSATLFAETYPNLEQFMPFLDSGMSSAMSRRLLGTA